MKARQTPVFIIDDSVLFGYWMSAEMELKRSCHAFHYTNPETALSEMQEIRPKVVLLDYHLGKGMDGGDVLVKIKQELPDTCVAIVTNETDVETIVGLMKLGADHVALKNKSSIDELIGMIV